MNDKIKIIVPVFFFVIIMLGQSCTYNKEELLYPGSNLPADCNAVSAKFSADVLPLITAKCAIPYCHDAGSASGGRIFQNYSQILDAKDRIKIRAVEEKSMPETGPLLPSEVTILKCWIESGAPNN